MAQFLSVRNPGGLGWVLCSRLYKTKVTTLAGLDFYLEALGKNPLPSSFRFLKAFISLRLQNQNPHFLAGCQSGSTFCNWKLSTHIPSHMVPLHILNSNGTQSPSHTSYFSDLSSASVRRKLSAFRDSYDYNGPTQII